MLTDPAGEPIDKAGEPIEEALESLEAILLDGDEGEANVTPLAVAAGDAEERVAELVLVLVFMVAMVDDARVLLVLLERVIVVVVDVATAADFATVATAPAAERLRSAFRALLAPRAFAIVPCYLCE